MTGLHFAWVPPDPVPEIRRLTRSRAAEDEPGERSPTAFTANDSIISFTTAMYRRLGLRIPSAAERRTLPRGCGQLSRVIEGQKRLMTWWGETLSSPDLPTTE